MRLPRLRLPRARLSFEWLGVLGGRNTLLYMGYTSALFIVFLVFTFPHELMIRRALSSVNRGPVTVEFSAARLAWLDGYELSGTRIASASTDDQPPYVEVSHLWMRPALGGLVRGDPYDLLVRADLYGGSAEGELNMTDGGVVGNLHWQGLNLGRYRTLTALLDEGQLTGNVSGQFTFEARGANFNNGQGSGVLVLDTAGLTGGKVAGITVPDVHLRQCKLKFAVRPGHVEIQEFQATGDATVTGSGQIVLRDPASESTLNIRAVIETSLASPDSVKALVALLPHPASTKPDAPVSINLSGTLGHPRLR